MEGFHRYMASNRAARLWARMVRELAPPMIVPQHGLPMRGQTMERFLGRIERLECGVDLIGPEDYRL